jgi:hypothetical protein
MATMLDGMLGCECGGRLYSHIIGAHSLAGRIALTVGIAVLVSLQA